MAKSREEVHKILQSFMDDDKQEQVYFNPPENLRMKYPCIVYHTRSLDHDHADNQPYFIYDVYDVIVIYRTMDDAHIAKDMANSPGFEYDRFYNSDNLHHDSLIFRVY